MLFAEVLHCQFSSAKKRETFSGQQAQCQPVLSKYVFKNLPTRLFRSQLSERGLHLKLYKQFHIVEEKYYVRLGFLQKNHNYLVIQIIE